MTTLGVNPALNNCNTTSGALEIAVKYDFSRRVSITIAVAIAVDARNEQHRPFFNISRDSYSCSLVSESRLNKSILSTT